MIELRWDRELSEDEEILVSEVMLQVTRRIAELEAELAECVDRALHWAEDSTDKLETIVSLRHCSAVWKRAAKKWRSESRAAVAPYKAAFDNADLHTDALEAKLEKAGEKWLDELIGVGSCPFCRRCDESLWTHGHTDDCEMGKALEAEYARGRSGERVEGAEALDLAVDMVHAAWRVAAQNVRARQAWDCLNDALENLDLATGETDAGAQGQ